MEHIVMCEVEFEESDVNDVILNFTGFHLRHYKSLNCRQIACLDTPYVSEDEEERLRTRRRLVKTFPTTNPRFTFHFKVGGVDTAGHVCRTKPSESENRRRRVRSREGEQDEFNFHRQHFNPTGRNQRTTATNWT
ncbi:hypothetical protein CAEBREN_18205 [Caenorhabditis brenneri]|uniref:Uncharacterized protein n=1 Tax=Caenorhabditis brenneri TaxID=135651 RepID=G0NEL4_CAEBE|nr:hypothetical protein CAEBREN_18205 [Caenorhabditis brenneri]